MQTAGYATDRESIPASYTELDDRYGGKIEEMLAHWLDNEALAARLRRPVLLAIARNQPSYDPARESSDDWIFGEARREARALIGPEGAAGVIPVMRKPLAGPAPGPARAASGRVQREDDEDDDAPPRRRLVVPKRWVWLTVFAGLALGIALIVATAWLGTEPYLRMATPRPAPVPAPAPSWDEPVLPQAPPAEPPSAWVDDLPKLDAVADADPLPPPPLVVPSLAAPPPPPAPPPVPPQPRAIEPLRAPAPPELTRLPQVLRTQPAPPPALARPAEPPAPAAGPRPLPGPTRVFIHYSAIGGQAVDEAERLARLLRQQGFTVADVREVPFAIDEPSVRYFFAGNQGEAQTLVELSSRALPGMSGLARRGASDFTHFEPRPQPGTLEIWLPAG
ncbi:LytR C-terminal domain-containing protein [Geminicoccus roseus]|uniref:LytR C-terminal domain-containing protein n=1 Tax=Geminicoccus roseus TaxID=404900 RepID=UPI0004226FB7|nr:LytR C-terminal domain-containing protein [Geminicoccus roseus]